VTLAHFPFRNPQIPFCVNVSVPRRAGHGFVAGYIKARINITRGAFTPLIEDENPSPICYLAMGRDVASVKWAGSSGP
jgi:hypothetical protein